MPLYEFLCEKCRKKFTVLCSIAERDSEQVCQQCGSKTARRLVSRFKTIRSEEQLAESLADPSALSGIDENDPSSVAKWAKKMAREMGENMDEEIEQMAQEELAGETNDTGELAAPPMADL